MKAIMLSIKSKWVEKILNGEKTIEIRKTMPKCELPVKVYIYCAKAVPNKQDCYPLGELHPFNGGQLNGKVVAEFTLNKITNLNQMPNLKRTGLILSEGAIDMGQFNAYGGRYAWHINNLKTYDKPKELKNFWSSFYCSNIRNVDVVKNALDEWVTQYENNFFCRRCKYFNGDYNSCDKGYKQKQLTRPPRAWCYVEELEVL